MRGKPITRYGLLTGLALAALAGGCAPEPVVQKAPVAAFDPAACPAETRGTLPASDAVVADDTTLEKSGAGLWIGGAPFARGTIADARASIIDSSREPAVNLTLTEAGRLRFRCVQEGRVGRGIEISFDRKLLSRPILHETVLGVSVQISGVGTMEEANRLAARFKDVGAQPQ